MSLKHAILGFLSYEPSSGYDLKKAFDRSVQHFWPANQSQIYRTLARMLDEGLVTQEVVEREDRLDLKVYHITAAGHQALHDWLATPLPGADYREPFLIQLFFGGQLSDEELDQVLQHEIEGMRKKLAAYGGAYAAFKSRLPDHDRPRDYFLSVLTMEYGLCSTLMGLEWLESVAKRVENRDYDLRDFEIAPDQPA